MKKQIRYGVFETNSSSTHTITLTTIEEYIDWEKGKIYLNGNHEIDGKFVARDVAVEIILHDGQYEEDELDDYIFSQYQFDSYERYIDDDELEDFYEELTTPKGETVVAFGKFGMG